MWYGFDKSTLFLFPLNELSGVDCTYNQAPSKSFSKFYIFHKILRDPGHVTLEKRDNFACVLLQKENTAQLKEEIYNHAHGFTRKYVYF